MTNNLVEIKNNQVVVSSRQIAENFGKNHSDVMKSIKCLIDEGISKISDTPEMFYKTTYVHEQNKQEYPMYLMNRDGFTLLVMGFNGAKAIEWKIKYIQAFNEMEKELQTSKQQQSALPDFTNPVAAARAWADELEAKQKALAQIEQDKPKVEFANAVTASKDCIYIRELAKILQQNGFNTGEKRLYKWLRNNGYLIKDRRDRDYNQPTQRAQQLKIFKVHKSVYETSLGEMTSTTTLVTPKGQQYFISKFKEKFLPKN